METILSVKNERVKQWKKLQTRKGREKAKRYLIEGFHLVEEAIHYDALIVELLISEEHEDLAFKYPLDKQVMISKEIANQLSETPTTQGVFAVISLQKNQATPTFTKPFLCLDTVQDPGNLGTMIRTADAAGFGGVVLGSGTVDMYNSKVLRSMQGSHFHLPIFEGDLTEWFETFKQQNVPIYGTELNEAAVSYTSIPKTDAFAIVMGNEGNGMQDDLLAKTTKNLYIPITGKAESLNVAVAAGILMFTLKK